VVVATKVLSRDEMLTAEMVRVQNFPAELAPAGAAAKIEDVLNRTLLGPVIPNEPLLEGKLAPKGGGRGLAARVPAGLRAFTIQTLNVASGVAGFVLPGNHVDVLLTVVEGNDDESGGGSTSTLLQNLEILAVDQEIDAPTGNKVDAQKMRSVTLLVTPDQASMLDLGQSKGTLHLSLRNASDKTDIAVTPVTVNHIRYKLPGKSRKAEAAVVEAPKPAPAPPPAAPAPPVEMGIIRTVKGAHERLLIFSK
jgi:pilus assembly protein CpaB